MKRLPAPPTGSDSERLTVRPSSGTPGDDLCLHSHRNHPDWSFGLRPGPVFIMRREVFCTGCFSGPDRVNSSSCALPAAQRGCVCVHLCNTQPLLYYYINLFSYKRKHKELLESGEDKPAEFLNTHTHTHTEAASAEHKSKVCTSGTSRPTAPLTFIPLV